MTFKEKYDDCIIWHEKVLVISLYHTAQCLRHKDWTLSKTADHFGISIGLVSENLKLANAIHKNEKLMRCGTRQEALRKIG